MLRTLTIMTGLLLSAGMASADTLDPTIDPLHIECTGCNDNGTNTPLPTSTTAFGFSSSPAGDSGVLWLNVLIPNNVNLATFLAPHITGTASGTTTLFSTTAWTTETENAYLGGLFNDSPSPNNNISAYLGATQAVDPGATGFFDFQLNAGTFTLNGSGAALADTFTLGGNLPAGSYITAMLLRNNNGNLDVVNTANSGAGFVDPLVSPTPLPAALPLMFSGLGCIWLASRRRKQQRLPV